MTSLPYRSPFFSFFTDLFQSISSRLACGPSTDPNKLVPMMAQYPADKRWPLWCRASSFGAYIDKVSFLDSLPHVMEGKPQSILGEVDRLVLQRLTHYKCKSDWNHEFIHAEFFDTHSKERLTMLWERDLPLAGPRSAKKRDLQIKSGRHCEAIDRVTFVTDADFANFVQKKEAVVLQMADIPAPGLNILQVASVLEIHSTSFPTYHAYSTMCYWYADSTFEVLVEMSQAKLYADIDTLSRKGVVNLYGVSCATYRGVTRKSLVGSADALLDDLYHQKLVAIQGELITRYEGGLKVQEDDDIPEGDRQAIKQSGWNVAQFLRMVQTMPCHEKLLSDSVAREQEVRGILTNIQNHKEEAAAMKEREAEAKRCTEMEEIMTKEEHKWMDKVSEVEKEREQQRKRAEKAEAKQKDEWERAEREQGRADRLAHEIAQLRRRTASVAE